MFISIPLAVLLIASAVAGTKGSMKIMLENPVFVGGKTIGPGECLITWVTHSPETEVSFALHGKVVAEAQAKMVEGSEKAEFDMMTTLKDDAGNAVVKELRMAGKKSVLTIIKGD